MTASQALANGGVALYGAALTSFVASAARGHGALSRRVGRVALAGACVVLGAGIALRWAESGHAPFVSRYDGLLLGAFLSLPITVALGRATRVQVPGALTAGFGLVCLGYASFCQAEPRPLIPILRSNWLFVHVTASIAAYAAFGIAFAAALWSLARRKEPRATRLRDEAVWLGFLAFTLGTLSGAVWANESWGRYWSWDPKETSSLVIWCVYAAHLHATRKEGGWGRRWLPVIGFAAVLLNYLAVSAVLGGQHGYE